MYKAETTNIPLLTFFLDKKSKQKNQDQLTLPAAQADASRQLVEHTRPSKYDSHMKTK